MKPGIVSLSVILLFGGPGGACLAGFVPPEVPGTNSGLVYYPCRWAGSDSLMQQWFDINRHPLYLHGWYDFPDNRTCNGYQTLPGDTTGR
jgi:hypothetical protein